MAALREAQARVARDRAAHFASGLGAGGGEAVAPAASAAGGAPARAWPGPFATARALIARRDAAARAREAGDEGDGCGTEGGASPASAVAAAAAGRSGTAATTGPASRSVFESDFAPTAEEWSPATKAALAAASAAARAAAPPSPLPTLFSLALARVVALFGHVEELGPLSPATLGQLALALCRARALDNHAFRVFAAASGAEVRVPDCAGVDEVGMVAGLLGLGGGGARAPQAAPLVGGVRAQTEAEEAAMFDAAALGGAGGGGEEGGDDGGGGGGPGALRVLSLAHAGRGFTDRAVRALLRPRAGAAEGAPPPFSALQELRLAGAYALSDGGGVAPLLAAAGGCLRVLSLRACASVRGTVFSELPRACPRLAVLEVAAPSAALTEAVLFGAAAPRAAGGGGGGAAMDEEAAGGRRGAGKGQGGGDEGGRKGEGGGEGNGTEEEAEGGGEEKEGGGGGGGTAAAGRAGRADRSGGVFGLGEGALRLLQASLGVRARATSTTVLPSLPPLPPRGGVLALRSLSALSLAHVPCSALSPGGLVTLLRALGPRLAALRLEAVEAAGDGACAAIAGAAVPFKALRSLALCALPAVTDAGVDAIAEALQAAWVDADGGPVPGALPRPLAALQLSALPRVARPDVVLALVLGAAGGFGGPSTADRGGGLASVRLSSLPGLGDAALVALARAAGRSLKRLDVSMSRGATDAGVGALCDACPRLRRLVLWGCTQLTGELHLGHARSGWAGREGERAPERCRAHPDLPWEPLLVVGKPGDGAPEVTVDDWDDPLGAAWPGDAL
jgi:hypothetical protein